MKLYQNQVWDRRFSDSVRSVVGTKCRNWWWVSSQWEATGNSQICRHASGFARVRGT